MVKRYHKKATQTVIAVQLDLDTEGLHYQKWGDRQFAKKDDWLVNNNGSIYSIDNPVFTYTYRQVSSGEYQKVSDIYAQRTDKDDYIDTLEGKTHYLRGDYLVCEKPGQAKGAYAVSAEVSYDLVADEY